KRLPAVVRHRIDPPQCHGHLSFVEVDVSIEPSNSRRRACRKINCVDNVDGKRSSGSRESTGPTNDRAAANVTLLMFGGSNSCSTPVVAIKSWSSFAALKSQVPVPVSCTKSPTSTDVAV